MMGIKKVAKSTVICCFENKQIKEKKQGYSTKGHILQ